MYKIISELILFRKMSRTESEGYEETDSVYFSLSLAFYDSSFFICGSSYTTFSHWYVCLYSSNHYN